MKKTLKPCPVCGEENSWITLTREIPGSCIWAEITCQRCLLKMEGKYNTAIEMWNIASKKKMEQSK